MTSEANPNFIYRVPSLRDRDLGNCPRCQTKIQFKNALLCYPLPGKYLSRFPTPEECSGADIHCIACELVLFYRRIEK